ncbi:MAG: hypothetical protein K5864_08265 [Bacteroidales bacterium]|nr:hypothetical protein [Bacteroidales bacterium]
MKKRYRTKKGIIALVVIAVALTVLMLAIIFNWCYFTKESNAIVTLVGIVLAFISILLSYKGLVNTQDVKHNLEQQEFDTVAKLVMVINEFKMLINFSENVSGKSNDCVGIYWSNIWGLNSINNKIKEEYPQFVNSSLFFAESFQFPFINQFVSNPSTPSTIVEQLVKLDRKFFEENNVLMNGNCVAVNDLNKNDTKYRQSGLS